MIQFDRLSEPDSSLKKSTSRERLGMELDEVDKRHEGVFQEAARGGCASLTSAAERVAQMMELHSVRQLSSRLASARLLQGKFSP